MARIERVDAFIRSLGLDSYRVGGSVRDELIGRRPKDADYVVFGSSLTELQSAVAAAGAKVSKLQLRDRRVVGVRASGRGLGLVEIALPRTERSTGTGRHDFEIVVDPSLTMRDDCIRRDFTFNALYKPITTDDPPVIDPTGRGLYDLQHRLVKTTHPDSFRDDPLRALRALRFVSTLGFDLATATQQEMIDHADAVTGLTQKGVSGTVLEELSKLLMGDRPAEALRLARDTGVLAVLIPELEPMLGFDQRSRWHDLTVDEHTFKALSASATGQASLRVRMSLLFHDSGKPASAWEDARGRRHYYAHEKNGFREHDEIGVEIARRVLKRLNAPRTLINDVCTLIELHMLSSKERVKDSDVGRMRVRLGDDLFRDLIMHRACDFAGKDRVNPEHASFLVDLEQVRGSYQDRGIPSSVKDLRISGYDLIELGIQGPTIGKVLARVLDEVVCQPNEQTMTRDWQLARAERLQVLV